ncbi:USP6 N-terminal-like protein isoform X2 [Hydra vulgaris]|uniref:USP6 N-terminal-like protein isoform X2 n=1 Tax=Hydra vulgaris TaxID=6087 RepID=A0ABM4CKE3_HYDVU
MSEYIDDEDSAKVRAAIVERYKRGPQGPVDPWEDASFIVYQVMDHYGFLHKNPLPVIRDPRMEEIELERAGKWIKMFSNWKNYFNGDKPSEKLRRRIYKGIPPRVRGEAWKKILNLQNVAKKGVYEKFKKVALENSPDIRQIDLDVNRTYRDHIMFRDRFGVKQQALFNVLAAYSIYNTEVGYCQGMSGIVALLLMYMDEEATFWALSELLADRKHAMHGLFVPGFPKLIRFQNHHDKVVKKLLPKLGKHLEEENVNTNLYTLKWFMQCFLDRLPFSLVLRVYDIYMIDGDRILTAMAYHILKIFRKRIMKMDFESIAPFLQEEIPNSNLNDDLVLEELQESMNELKKAKLDVCPPPSSSELPTKVLGTLPDRNSFMTASKRARSSGDRKSIVEVPIGRPPSPVLSSNNIVTVSGYEKPNNQKSSSFKNSADRKKLKESSSKILENGINSTSPPRHVQKDTSLQKNGQNSYSNYDEEIYRKFPQHFEEKKHENGYAKKIAAIPLPDYSDDSEYENDDAHSKKVSGSNNRVALSSGYATQTHL